MHSWLTVSDWFKYCILVFEIEVNDAKEREKNSTENIYKKKNKIVKIEDKKERSEKE